MSRKLYGDRVYVNRRQPTRFQPQELLQEIHSRQRTNVLPYEDVRPEWVYGRRLVSGCVAQQYIEVVEEVLGRSEATRFHTPAVVHVPAQNIRQAVGLQDNDTTLDRSEKLRTFQQTMLQAKDKDGNPRIDPNIADRSLAIGLYGAILQSQKGSRMYRLVLEPTDSVEDRLDYRVLSHERREARNICVPREIVGTPLIRLGTLACSRSEFFELGQHFEALDYGLRGTRLDLEPLQLFDLREQSY